MTREEIREGIRGIVKRYEEDDVSDVAIPYQHIVGYTDDYFATEILQYLHSQGVAIKKDKPFRIGEIVNDDGLTLTEPLIEEE